jgi:hypothetical protein
MRKIKAWVVTWEWIGDHAKRDEVFLAALDSRLSPDTVRGYVELLYLSQCSSLSDRVAYARSRKAVPFPAKFMDIEGVPWHVAIHCGDNPFLLARRVDDLIVNTDAEGKQGATWKERQINRYVSEGKNRTDGED